MEREIQESWIGEKDMKTRLIEITFIVGLHLCCFGTTPIMVRLGSLILLGTILVLPIMQIIDSKYRQRK